MKIFGVRALESTLIAQKPAKFSVLEHFNHFETLEKNRIRQLKHIAGTRFQAANLASLF
jgi:hypothetical protein